MARLLHVTGRQRRSCYILPWLPVQVMEKVTPPGSIPASLSVLILRVDTVYTPMFKPPVPRLTPAYWDVFTQRSMGLCTSLILPTCPSPTFLHVPGTQDIFQMSEAYGPPPPSPCTTPTHPRHITPAPVGCQGNWPPCPISSLIPIKEVITGDG